MSNNINMGWLTDNNGDKFAPKTLTGQVFTVDGTNIENKISKDITSAKSEVLDELRNSIANFTLEDTNISWGTKGLANNISPVDAAISNVHSANRFAFAKPQGIAIEYSTDGETYIDYETNDSDKIKLVSGISVRYSSGARNTETTTNDKLRITLHATNMGVYTRLRKLLIQITRHYATGAYVIVEKSIKRAETEFEFVGKYTVSGSSGWNSIPIGNGKGLYFGGNESQLDNVAAIRLTFGLTGIDTTKTSNSLDVSDIIGIGDTYWSWPSTMARTGHLYSYDVNQNATFPAEVKAAKFTGTLSGNADTATKALQDGDGNVITDTYATKEAVGDKPVSEQISEVMSSLTDGTTAVSKAINADTATTSVGIITSGTGDAYIATVPNIESLEVGVSFVMIPHTVSTSTSPTLNVNGLGAKEIRRYRSLATAETQTFRGVAWAASGKPVRVIYDGTYWIAENHSVPTSADLGIPNASTSRAGLMSAADKEKLTNIEDNANNYIHPTTAGNKHIPSGGSSGQVLGWSSSGTAKWTTPKFLPSVTTSNNGQFLRVVDGAWAAVTIKTAESEAL